MNESLKTAKNCRHYAMCKIDFLGSGVCASGLEKHFVSFYPQGRMILYESLADNKITVTEKCVEIAVTSIYNKDIMNESLKTAKNCRHYAMCKIDFLGSGVCASGLEKHFAH